MMSSPHSGIIIPSELELNDSENPRNLLEKFYDQYVITGNNDWASHSSPTIWSASWSASLPEYER
jgi:hypothetical protein